MPGRRWFDGSRDRVHEELAEADLQHVLASAAYTDGDRAGRLFAAREGVYDPEICRSGWTAGA